MSAFLCTTATLSAQEILWQQNIQPYTQDFLLQYLLTRGSIQCSTLQQTQGKQNNDYNFRLLKIDQQGNGVLEKCFYGQNHDFLSVNQGVFFS